MRGVRGEGGRGEGEGEGEGGGGGEGEGAGERVTTFGPIGMLGLQRMCRRDHDMHRKPLF